MDAKKDLPPKMSVEFYTYVQKHTHAAYTYIHTYVRMIFLLFDLFLSVRVFAARASGRKKIESKKIHAKRCYMHKSIILKALSQ